MRPFADNKYSVEVQVSGAGLVSLIYPRFVNQQVVPAYFEVSGLGDMSRFTSLPRD